MMTIIDRTTLERRYHDELATLARLHQTEVTIDWQQTRAEIRAELLAELLNIADPRPLWQRA